MTNSTVLALSINGGIKTLGAYAGLAAVVALALLALLYFAQARELKRLREFIEREAQRARLAPPPPPPRAAPVAGVTPVVAPPPAPVPPPVVGVVGAVPATPLMAASVEGVRRVPLPAAAAGDVAPRPPLPPAPPDATTVSEPPPDEPLEPARLIAERVVGFEPGSAHEIGGGVLLGRGKTASIHLTDRLASGRHARVAPDGDHIVLEDLGSTNGTFLNGVQLSAPAALQSGDRIRLGESEFVFEDATPPPPPAPPPPPPAAQNTPQDPPEASVDAAAATEIEGGGDSDATEIEGGGESDATEAQPPSAAVPLLAAPVPERSVALPDESTLDVPAFAAIPSAPVPAPHPDSPMMSVAPPPAPASITRRARVAPPEEFDGPPRRARRLRGAGELPGSATRRLLVGGGIVALVAIAAVVLLLHGPSGAAKSPPHKTTPTQPPASANHASAPPARSTITVAVLNGTSTVGAAGQVATKLVADGFAKGAVADATGPAATTSVGYTAGHKAAAEEVAAALHLGKASVTPISSATDSTASVGGRLPQVVVTIGAK